MNTTAHKSRADAIHKTKKSLGLLTLPPFAWTLFQRELYNFRLARRVMRNGDKFPEHEVAFARTVFEKLAPVYDVDKARVLRLLKLEKKAYRNYQKARKPRRRRKWFNAAKKWALRFLKEKGEV